MLMAITLSQIPDFIMAFLYFGFATVVLGIGLCLIPIGLILCGLFLSLLNDAIFKIYNWTKGVKT